MLQYSVGRRASQDRGNGGGIIKCQDAAVLDTSREHVHVSQPQSLRVCVRREGAEGIAIQAMYSHDATNTT